MSTIGDRLRKERERLGFSQTDFGARGGVKKLAQLKYEKGERVPSADYLQAIAFLGVDIAYILHGNRSERFPREIMLLNGFIKALAARVGINGDALFEIFALALPNESHREQYATPLVSDEVMEQLWDALIADGKLLFDVVVAVDAASRGRDNPLPLPKYVGVVLMLHRVFCTSKQIEAHVVDEAVALASIQ